MTGMRARWLAPVAALAFGLVGVSSVASGQEDRRATRRAAEQRRGAERPEARRGVQRSREDTGSLVVPLRRDTLIGIARGSRGVVTLRGECAACHEGVHDMRLGRGAAAAAPCLECHTGAHAATQALYSGRVRRVDARPDTMFLARVACLDCHTDTTFALPAGTARLAALDRMCTSCHGDRFSGMLARWREGLSWRQRAVDAYVARAGSDGRLGAGGARTRARHAGEVMAFLREAGAIHGVRGADRIFRAALDSAAAAYAHAGVAAPAPPRLGPDPARSSCLLCHYGVETVRQTVFGETFDHATHVVRGDVACSRCHSDANFFTSARGGRGDEERRLDPRHGKTTLTAGSCDGCHHSPRQKLSCAGCHGDDARLGRPMRVTMALHLTPEGAPTRRTVPFAHADHPNVACASCHTTPGKVRDVAACRDCHQDHHREQVRSCTDCHGATMRADHRRDAHLKCASCHAAGTVAMLLPNRSVCTSCHTAQEQHVPARECAPCHLQATPAEVRRRMLATVP
jgi:hypothetical protein